DDEISAFLEEATIMDPRFKSKVDNNEAWDRLKTAAVKTVGPELEHQLPAGQEDRAERLIILDNIGSVARARAIMPGVIYTLNWSYPKELRYYHESIQKVLLQIDGERLSPKVLGLKNQIHAGL
ncbi:hypothetical protein NHX12_024127, partial [Muraenolepis orangiensis]